MGSLDPNKKDKYEIAATARCVLFGCCNDGKLERDHFTESQQLWKKYSPDVLGQDRPGFRFHMLYACAWQACHE
jgi:hypothetical protein